MKYSSPVLSLEASSRTRYVATICVAILLVSPVLAVPMMQGVQVASMQLSKMGVTGGQAVLGLVINVAIATVVLGVLYNFTGEAQESGEWGESGNPLQILTLTESIAPFVLVAMVAGAIGIAFGGRRRR